MMSIAFKIAVASASAEETVSPTSIRGTALM